MDETPFDYTNWAAGQPDGIVTRPVSWESDGSGGGGGGVCVCVGGGEVTWVIW